MGNVDVILAQKHDLKRVGHDDDNQYRKSWIFDVLIPSVYLLYLLKVLKDNIL